LAPVVAFVAHDVVAADQAPRVRERLFVKSSDHGSSCSGRQLPGPADIDDSARSPAVVGAGRSGWSVLTAPRPAGAALLARNRDGIQPIVKRRALPDP